MALRTDHQDGVWEPVMATDINTMAATVNGLALGGGPIGFQYTTEAAGGCDIVALRATTPAAVYGAEVTSTSGMVTVDLPDPVTTEDLNIVVFAASPLDTMASFEFIDSNGNPAIVAGTPDLSDISAAFACWPIGTVWGVVQVTTSGSGGASEAYVDAAVATAIDDLLDGAPGALDTLNELAAAINDDASFAASITSALAGKAPTSRTLAGLDLSANRSAADLQTALGLGALAYLSAVSSANITDGTIVDADINASAGIQRSKLATPPSGLYTSGELYSVQSTTGGTRTIAPGSVFFYPIGPEGPLSIAGLAYQVVTGAASGTAHVYLVTADPTTGRPSTSSTILKSVALADTATSSAKVVANFVSAYAAAPGLYWGAIHAINGTATYSTTSSVFQLGPPLRRAVGYSTNGLTAINATGAGTSTTPLTSLSGLTFQTDVNQAPIIEWKAA